MSERHEMNNTVVACVDGSSSTKAVCEYAAWAASALKISVALLHVLEKSDQPLVSDLTGTIGLDSREHFTDELVRLEGERNRLLMTQGKVILKNCAELLTEAGLPAPQQLQKHGALDGILAELGDTRLMVLGRRGAYNPVGSHIENVIRLQKNPVLIVPETFSFPSRVMFAFDGSEASLENLRRLSVSPLFLNLTCHLVMVNGNSESLDAAQSLLQRAGITSQASLLKADTVANALCRYAGEHGIDLMVMGAYGHSRLRRFFIGSNTAEMLSNSSQPLLMLR